MYMASPSDICNGFPVKTTLLSNKFLKGQLMFLHYARFLGSMHIEGYAMVYTCNGMYMFITRGFPPLGKLMIIGGSTITQFIQMCICMNQDFFGKSIIPTIIHKHIIIL